MGIDGLRPLDDCLVIIWNAGTDDADPMKVKLFIQAASINC